MDIASFRKAAKLSQEELGRRVNLNQSQISRIEHGDLSDLSVQTLVKLIQAVGLEPPQLLYPLAARAGAIPPDAGRIDAGKPYERLFRNLRLLGEYFDTAPLIEDAPENQGAPSTAFSSLKRLLGRKPYAVLAGGFDSAKSRCANSILGGNFLPTHYQPATRLRTVVRHISDRPDWLREEVWIFKAGFDPERLNDQNHCTSHRLVAGSIETLEHYAVHGGRFAEDQEADSAVAFIDAPVLEAMTIVDLPGYENDERDSSKADAGRKLMDLLIYLSPANGFLRAADHALLAHALRHLPAPEEKDPDFPVLGNFFIIASHASEVFQDHELQDILNLGSARLYPHLKDILDKRASATGCVIDASTLRSRFFTFWFELASRRRGFEDDLRTLLGSSWPRHQFRASDRTIAAFKQQARLFYEDRIRAFEYVMENLESAETLLKKCRDDEPSRKVRAQAAAKAVAATASRLKHESLREFETLYEMQIRVDDLEQLIDQNYDTAGEAKEYAMGRVIEVIQSRINRIIGEKSEEFTEEIQKFLRDYPTIRASIPVSASGSPIDIPFDTTAAFIGGLAGLAAIGGLGTWAATLGSLGQYILVAKLVSILAALGIPTGGTAAVIAAVAAIGGPIVLTLAIACLAMLSAYTLFGDGWKRRLAKKLAKTLVENSVDQKFRDAIGTYWDDSISAFNAGSESIERQLAAHLCRLEEIVTADGGREKIEARLADYAAIRDFFAGLPWRLLLSIDAPGQRN